MLGVLPGQNNTNVDFGQAVEVEAFGQELTAADAASEARFGSITAVDGTTLVLSAPGDRNVGAAYVYTRSGAVWQRVV